MARRGRVLAVLCGVVIASATTHHAALVPLFADLSGDLLSGDGRDPAPARASAVYATDPLMDELDLLAPTGTRQDDRKSRARTAQWVNRSGAGTRSISAAVVEARVGESQAVLRFHAGSNRTCIPTLGAMMSEGRRGIPLTWSKIHAVEYLMIFTSVLTTEGVQNPAGGGLTRISCGGDDTVRLPYSRASETLHNRIRTPNYACLRMVSSPPLRREVSARSAAVARPPRPRRATIGKRRLA